MAITQLIYISQATPIMLHSDRPVADELKSLNAKARFENARIGVTGILLYKSGCFLQVLEGKNVVLGKLYEKIAKDPRHDHVERLVHLETESRLFEQWSMGVLNLDEQADIDRKTFDEALSTFRYNDPSDVDASHRGIVSLLRMFQRHETRCLAAH